MDELADDLRQLDFNHGAQQVAATSAPGLSPDSLSGWLQLQIQNDPSAQGFSALSSSHSQTISHPPPAHLLCRMIKDPSSWFHGETLPAIGDEMCYWAQTTCKGKGKGNAGTLATKACHFKTNHRPRSIYACSSCVVKHGASFDEVLDLHC
jgi:hypothetical protein